VAKGEPGCGFPAPWSVYRWLPGEPLPHAHIGDYEQLAEDLAGFLNALQQISTDGGPRWGEHSFNRGGPLSVWDQETQTAVSTVDRYIIDSQAVLTVWRAALNATWRGAPVWLHGDITGSNLLVRQQRLDAVIDFGCAAIGDPACDLAVAWTLFEGSSRRRFRSAVNADNAMWARARGWALWKALIQIARQAPNDAARTGTRFGWRWSAERVLSQVIEDFAPP
jgi:aminoglycoside phosphotransferase (APT) family kinase protein